MKLKIEKKVNSYEWLISTAYAENEFAYKVLNDSRLWSIGTWNLDYISFYDKDNLIGKCFISVNSNIVSIYGLIIYPWFRDKGYCTNFINLIIQEYNKYDIKLNTRSAKLIKVLDKLGFQREGFLISEYSNLKEFSYSRKINGTIK